MTLPHSELHATESQRENLRIGDVARLVGTTPRTIRYYEEIGLLAEAPARPSGQHRLYTEAEVERLREVMRLKELLGVSLEELKTLLTAEEARAEVRAQLRRENVDPARRRELLTEALGHIDRQLHLVHRRAAELGKLEEELSETRKRARRKIRALRCRERRDLPAGRGGAAEMNAPAVLVDDLVVRFGELTAVGGVSFAVAPGEVFGLLGPNGAGKTTTIRVLTTLLAPTEGRALVAGYDVRNDSLAVRASIGYIPQAISVDGALTAYENLDFYGRVTGVPRGERRERIEQAIETMELQPMLDRLARTLSGGMLRRLEIATALLNRPAVLFLDEPTVGLDPTARRMVWERLGALVEQSGTTILVTTHMMEEAERHCDRLGVIDHGRLVEQGEPAELLERHGTDSLEEVFTAVTGRPIELAEGEETTDEDEEGRLSDVRAQRRTARRLG